MTIMDLSLSQLSDEASHESSDSQDEAWAPGPGEDMTPLDAFVLGFTREEEEEEDDLQEEEETVGGVGERRRAARSMRHAGASRSTGPGARSSASLIR